ncbi:MAG: 30S ribosomal protein S6 [Candidatus Omnitrophota bacterium]|nr:30S ribosomal protein S6 [Candidatus Omnitrophota bacterium]
MERLYEAMLVLAADVGEKAQEEIFQKIIKKIESLGGKVASSKVWAKERSFCFFIKSRGAEKKKHHKGCYWLINFYFNTEKLLDLKETIRLDENILRSLILKIEKKQESLFTK